MRYLEEKGCGFDTGIVKVPIVPAAILFDLFLGDPQVRPGAAEGFQACLLADAGKVLEGSVGAGAGATVGKALGIARATKSGLGTASERIFGNIVVAALAVVNAFGEVVDPGTGRIIAGVRGDRGFISTMEILRGDQRGTQPFPASTTIGVVATNAALNKEQVNKLAQMAQNGLARAIRPCHTMFDGDVIFALALGAEESQTDVTALGAAAAEVMSTAILRAVTEARSLAGIPAIAEL
jgi:L-aminopeptidase/D-esterase-like protein